jgi:hypothetical protein
MAVACADVQQPFARAVCRDGITHNGSTLNDGVGGQTLAQRFGDISHGVKVVDARLDASNAVTAWRETAFHPVARNTR